MESIYKVKGMHCASCVRNIEKSLGKLEGVDMCEVNLATETAKVIYKEDITDIEAMNKKIKPMGYSFVEDKPKNSHKNHTNMSGEDHSAHLGLNESKEEKMQEIKAMKRNINIVIPFVVLSFLYMILDIGGKQGFFTEMPEWLYSLWHHLFPIMATYVLFVIGKQYIQALRRFIKTGIASMETLIGLGTVVGFLYSFTVGAFEDVLTPYLDISIHYYDVVIIVIGFIYYGKYLENRSKVKTGEAIEKLLNLQAKTALIERNGIEIEVPIEEVIIGDIVIIKPGSKIPTDGKIISGSSSIDESMITGESIPVDKNIDDSVIGGTFNKQGFLKVQATSLGGEGMLAHIIKMVQDAQGSKASIQKIADKISGVFVPIVLVIAFVSLIVWIVLGNPVVGIISFVTVLVIACPCALGLATPTAIIVGVGKGAEEGILIKNAESLQKMHKVTAMVFDKTGTITKGKPELVEYIGDNRSNDLKLLASLEKLSEHPIATAIVSKAHQEGVTLQEVIGFSVHEGKGLEGIIAGKKWIAGNLKMIKDNGIKYEEQDVSNLTSQGITPIFLADEQKVIAVFGVADTLKDNAKEAIAELHKLGIKSVMLTGDNKQTAHHIASQIGIDDVRAEVLPQEKGEVIKALQKEGYIVAMCGDGINDAPALALADVGLAMGTGTDVAIESADMTLLAGDISKVVKAIKLSKATMRTIKQNLFRAFIYNVIGIPLAAGLFYPIVLNPIFAGLAMAMSSVSVVANSLRLKKTRI